MSKTVRTYGKPPYRIAVLHGGPGAPGYMAPVACELSQEAGLIEPLQTKGSLRGQIDELIEQLTVQAETPAILIGSSWGAVLALFVAAERPELVARLILVGSAVFNAESSSLIEPRRVQRLTDEQRRRHGEIQRELKHASGDEQRVLFEEWGDLLFDADVYEPLTRDLETIEIQAEIFESVWSDFVSLRDTPGYLREIFSKITAPAVVIHGVYDPHPIEGIRPLLEACIEDVRFCILSKCGHYPWIERHARKEFFEIVFKEIAQMTENRG